MNERVFCSVRWARKALGLSQTELAEKIGVKRQTLYDIESGRYVPNTILALRIAKELGRSVEEIFTIGDPKGFRPVVVAEQPTPPGARVSLAKVGEQLVAYPLDGRWLVNEGFEAADGFLSQDCRHVQSFRGEDIDNNVMLLGCDPAFAILAAHTSRLMPQARIQCRFASSRLALERLAAGHAHIAGIHLHNQSSGESNLTFARETLGNANAAVIAFSSFDEGLLVAPGNPLQIGTVEDLAEKRTRFINREPGAALRILLDERLALAGIAGGKISGYEKQIPSHNLCAQSVALGVADAALGLRAVACAYGLDFIPMENVRCDLVIPEDFLALPAVKVLLDVLQSRSLREELSSLPGYDSNCTGKLIGRV